MKTKDQLVNLGLSEFKADEVMLLESEMLKRAVKFSFKKKDGKIREAVGTLDPEKMIMENDELWTPKGEAKPESAENLRYWDLVKKMWREMKLVNFVAMEG